MFRLLIKLEKCFTLLQNTLFGNMQHLPNGSNSIITNGKYFIATVLSVPHYPLLRIINQKSQRAKTVLFGSWFWSVLGDLPKIPSTSKEARENSSVFLKIRFWKIYTMFRRIQIPLLHFGLLVPLPFLLLVPFSDWFWSYEICPKILRLLRKLAKVLRRCSMYPFPKFTASSDRFNFDGNKL